MGTGDQRLDLGGVAPLRVWWPEASGIPPSKLSLADRVDAIRGNDFPDTLLEFIDGFDPTRRHPDRPLLRKHEASFRQRL